MKILIADDNVDAADTLGMLLELLGHEMHVVHDGTAAVQAAFAIRPRVVICDIGMPGLDGYQVARSIRAAATETQPLMIACTGYGNEADRRAALEAGFDHHLVKPVPVAELLAALAQAD